MPDEPRRIKGLSREQKIGFVLLSLFAVLAIGLGALQIRNTLYGPFALNKEIPPFIEEEINTPEALRYRDTDLDGLNDFDELYVYTTSPYLADTDSDAISDKQEIDKGQNPLCAEGRPCEGPALSADYTPPAAPPGGTPPSLGLTPPAGAMPDLRQILSNPEELRALLLQSGMDEQMLQKISNADLLKTVEDMMRVSTATLSGIMPAAER